ncbi:MAG: molybdopterin dinucleotide binding domain-containing protein [Anaerolineaceae bacterium]|jgi:anaerobic selenocysteine-containing dehydrogenase
MSDKISRRDFLRLAGAGAATTAVLTGCGPAARYVVRKPYTEMPEFNQTGISTYYATTCRDCAAGCGLILRTREGRALKAEGNPSHPVNKGKICPRGLTAVQGLYNPDRIQNPRRYPTRGGEQYEELQWEQAISVVSAALANAGSAAFLMGYAPDHLFDLVTELAAATGAPAPVRYGALGMFESRATLVKAAAEVYGEARLPYFDFSEADIVFTFGANFLDTWLSPVSYSKAYGQMRRGRQGRRGYLVSFEPRQSLTSGNADEWFAIPPGSEGMIAQAIGALVAQIRGDSPPLAFNGVDVAQVAQVSGIPIETLERLARLFAAAERAVAIPGGAALATSGGLAAARTVLLLNTLVQNEDRPGGVYLTDRFIGEAAAAENLDEVRRLISRMHGGQVQTLFIHGINPLFELPAMLGFANALQNVPTVISFASFPDETALASDYVLPDHTNLESWGYQTHLAGSDRRAISAAQPVVAPMYNTRATADVLIEAARLAGVPGLPYIDEVDFIQQKIAILMGEAGGNFTAADALTFWSRFLQHGGWWQVAGDLAAANGDAALEQAIRFPALPTLASADHYHLVVYPTHLGDGSGANRPHLQETPNPNTTVTWNSWVEINPETAEHLGIHDDDIVRVRSQAGSVEAVTYLYPAIRPDTVAIPFGQGHTALGRFAEGRGANPAQLLQVAVNEAGDLAYAETTVTLERTGRRRPLGRAESKAGVYGKH